MTSASGSLLYVRKYKRHARPSRLGRVLLGTLIVGAGGVAIAAMATTMATVSLKRMYAVPLELRADGLTTVAFGATPRRLAWTAPTDAEGARMLVVAGLPVTVRVAAGCQR